MPTGKKNYLPMFLITILLLIIIGIIFIYSSSSVYALQQTGNGHYYVQKQLIGLALGLLGMLITSIVPISYIKRFAPLIFLGALGFTLLTLIPHFGYALHGSRRWLSIGPLSLQPSELLKHALILYLGYYLSKKDQSLESFTSGYLPVLIIMAATSFILLKQPDFGMTITLCATAGFLLFIARLPIRYLLTTILAGIPAVLYLIIKTPYRLHRILSFLNPWDDPQGSGFQIIQSLIAIGSGGLFGLGIGSSKQKYFYLPMQHTDFIFSIMAEETGFIGSTILILLYATLLYAGLKLAWSLSNKFFIYSTIGFTLLTSLQAITNLLVTTGLLPTKGVGLPFVSYGNSSLIGNLLMVGLIINFKRNSAEPS